MEAAPSERPRGPFLHEGRDKGRRHTRTRGATLNPAGWGPGRHGGARRAALFLRLTNPEWEYAERGDRRDHRPSKGENRPIPQKRGTGESTTSLWISKYLYPATTMAPTAHPSVAMKPWTAHRTPTKRPSTRAPIKVITAPRPRTTPALPRHHAIDGPGDGTGVEACPRKKWPSRDHDPTRQHGRRRYRVPVDCDAEVRPSGLRFRRILLAQLVDEREDGPSQTCDVTAYPYDAATAASA